MWRHRLYLLKVATRPGGERFVPGSLGQWLDFPFRVADPRQPGNLAYLEWHAPDPRLALLVLLLGSLAAQRIWLRSTRPRGADASPVAARWPLWLFTVLWCLAWMHSSGNGRYAVGLLLLCSVLLVEGVLALLPAGRARQWVFAGLLGVHAFYALVAADRRDLGQSEAWSQAALAADMPSSLREQPHLHVALSQFSWTYLAPLMHPDSAFANLSSPCEYCSPPLQARSSMPVLSAWRGRLRLIAAADQSVDGRAGLLPDTERCVWTPSAVSVASASRPKGSAPMQPTNETGKPEEPATCWADRGDATTSSPTSISGSTNRPAPPIASVRRRPAPG